MSCTQDVLSVDDQQRLEEAGAMADRITNIARGMLRRARKARGVEEPASDEQLADAAHMLMESMGMVEGEHADSSGWSEEVRGMAIEVARAGELGAVFVPMEGDAFAQYGEWTRLDSLYLEDGRSFTRRYSYFFFTPEEVEALGLKRPWVRVFVQTLRQPGQGATCSVE